VDDQIRGGRSGGTKDPIEPGRLAVPLRSQATETDFTGDHGRNLWPDLRSQGVEVDGEFNRQLHQLNERSTMRTRRTIMAIVFAAAAGTLDSRPPVVRCRRSLLWTRKLR
jgi:hypothetical protein